jgi:hypothetical protein
MLLVFPWSVLYWEQKGTLGLVGVKVHVQI